MTVMYPFQSNQLKMLRDLFTKFIWDGKKPKIKWSVMTGLKVNGGVGLTNMLKKDHALKMSWVYKCLEDENIANMANCILENEFGNLLWSCQLDPKDIELLFPTESFWKHVLKTWVNFANVTLENSNDILDRWYGTIHV